MKVTYETFICVVIQSTEYTLQSVPGPEETASLLSRFTFAYVTGALFRAYKAPTLSVDELPQVSDKYNTENTAHKLKVNIT